MKILYCRHSILDLEEKIVWFLPVLVRTIIFHQSPNYKGLYNYIWRVKGSNHCCRNTPEMLLFEYRTEVFLSYLSQIKGKWVKTRGKNQVNYKVSISLGAETVWKGLALPICPRSIAAMYMLQLSVCSAFKVENSLESPFCLMRYREQGGATQVREDLALIS